MILMPQAPALPDDPANMAIFEPETLQAIAQHKVDTSKPRTSAQMAAAERNAEKEARLREKEDRLQAKSKEPRAPPPPPPPSRMPEPVVEKPIDKSHLLDKIEAYRKRFPSLKKRNNISAKSHVEECLDELHYIEMQLGSSEGNDGVAAMAFVTSVNMFETFTKKYYNPLNLRLDGLTQVTQDNMDQLAPILDELMIKYATGLYVTPETRLVMTFAAMVATVHTANNGDARTAEALSRASEVVAPPRGSESL